MRGIRRSRGMMMGLHILGRAGDGGCVEGDRRSDELGRES